MTQTSEQIWREYGEGTALLTRDGFYERSEECQSFYSGDQWRYLPTDGERLPVYNIIEPIVKYKTAVVAQNHLAVNYSFDVRHRPGLSAICRQAEQLLNQNALVLWEQNQMDQKCWEVVEDGCVTGASYLYFYMQNGKLQSDLLDGVNLIFGDEQETDINAQPYILVVRRRPVEQVRAEAVHGESRFDFSFVLNGKRCFLEVKGVTLETDGVCAFPDAPTQRGAKHLR